MIRRNAGKKSRKKRQQFPRFHLKDNVSFWEGSNVRRIKLMLGANIKGMDSLLILGAVAV